MGVLIQEISKEIADSLEMKSAKGALVSSATEGGPAFKAGVKTGDVIIKFNDIVIDNMKELPKVVASTPVGKSVPLVIWRNGKTITLNVVLGELELAEKDNLILSNDNVDDKKSKSFDKLGFVGEELNAENKKKYNIKDIKTGLLISDVKPDSTADKAGLKSGMVIVRVGQIEVQSLKIMDEAIQNAVKQKRKAILLLVKIEKGTRFVALELN